MINLIGRSAKNIAGELSGLERVFSTRRLPDTRHNPGCHVLEGLWELKQSGESQLRLSIVTATRLMELNSHEWISRWLFHDAPTPPT